MQRTYYPRPSHIAWDCETRERVWECLENGLKRHITDECQSSGRNGVEGYNETESELLSELKRITELK